ncbi:peptidylprolyl isomerase [Gorillibacterium sp. sgz5001074]|uniref:peptidylprolyl isomerase n=1 Tax=Gorillibacterium sp. sgz5001074 TaxID=3446695 RepID=UPI003F680B41
MTHQPTWFKLAGIAAISAVMLATSACGAKNQSGGSAPASTAPASSSPKASSAASAPAAASPTASASPAAGTAKRWSQPPAMQIDVKKSYKAEVKTSKGSFTIELFAKDAPKAVNNFVFLAREKFYDGIIFHRIIETFMIQTGDPKGNGTGGPGYKFDHEPTQYKYDKGIVAYANSGPNTNGSQFFIVTGEVASNLNREPNYTVFGKVIEGMDTVEKIAKTPVKVNPVNNAKETPTEKVTIDSIQIVEK